MSNKVEIIGSIPVIRIPPGSNHQSGRHVLGPLVSLGGRDVEPPISPLIFRYRFDRLNDLGVAGTAAEVAGDGDPDIFFGGSRVLIEKSEGAHDHARGTETALDGPVIDKGLLKGVKPLLIGKAFNGNNLATSTLAGQDQTGIDGLPIEKDGTGPALADPAAFLGAGETEFVSEKVDQAQVRPNFEGVFFTVDGKVEFNRFHSKLSGSSTE